MEQGDLPETVRPRQKLSERLVRPVLAGFQRLKEERAATFESQNPFGFNTPDFTDLTDDEKRQLWIAQGGKEFKDEVGEVRRYVIGVSPKIVDEIRRNGFDPEKKKANSYTALLPHFIGGTEGKGVYATTNPIMASREYGPPLVVVDVALGKVASPDKSRVLRLLNQLHEPIRWGMSSYIATVSVLGTALFLEGGSVMSSEAAVAVHAASLGLYLTQGFYFRVFQEMSGVDSMIIRPMTVPSVFNTIREIIKRKQSAADFVRKIQQHREWVVVRDPKRVKIVALFQDFASYNEQEEALVKH